MSNPAIPKLERIAAYIMLKDVPQNEMQAQYAAAAWVNKVIKEIKLGDKIKLQQAEQRRQLKKKSKKS